MREFILYILYYDFFYYLSHRLLHTKWLYKIHKIHHKNNKPTYYDYYTIHILELPLTSVGLFLAIYLYKLYIYQLLCCVIFINIRGIMEHEYRFVYLVGEHHLIHHKYFKYNYGEYWLDCIFGTLYSNTNKLIT
jgi:sterol desaturase/sphingolipid hydroxylase (fatty acid hydroxylase superfamily)